MVQSSSLIRPVNLPMATTLNRVYYLLRRNKTKLDTNTKKYDYYEVKSLKDSGLKPKEISEKLNIPIRTVYYILNNK